MVKSSDLRNDDESSQRTLLQQPSCAHASANAVKLLNNAGVLLCSGTNWKLDRSSSPVDVDLTRGSPLVCYIASTDTIFYSLWLSDILSRPSKDTHLFANYYIVLALLSARQEDAVPAELVR